MHQKKSEAQIGKDSVGVSADFNPNFLQIHAQTPKFELLSTPHKRPLLNSSLSHSQTLQSLHDLCSTPRIPNPNPSSRRRRVASTAAAVVRRLHVRLLLLAFPCAYFVLGDRKSLLLDFLSAIALSCATLFLLFLFFHAIPVPSLRLLLSRYRRRRRLASSPPPVLWSIGEEPKQKAEKLPISGCWVQVYSNGDVYEGEFHKGKCSGSGVYYYYMSGRYEGDWIDDKYDGFGVETWARGSRYRGQYRQGLRHGFGIYRFYTGDLYAGEWSSGQSHGCGVHTCEDGSRYIGEFKWGVKHGLGHYHFRNGDTYSGEYFADKMHGFGVYRFANGHRYEGAWHEGRRQGLGMYTFRNGETQSGYWENGVLTTTSNQSNQSSMPIAINHSKVLNVVQEARFASEKAFNVPRVDERVNKAVASANKAANAARVAAVKAVQKQVNVSRTDIPLPIV
ncbi:uncharacterized protein LOC144714870 [Wolffia australiana]